MVDEGTPSSVQGSSSLSLAGVSRGNVRVTTGAPLVPARYQMSHWNSYITRSYFQSRDTPWVNSYKITIDSETARRLPSEEKFQEVRLSFINCSLLSGIRGPLPP